MRARVAVTPFAWQHCAESRFRAPTTGNGTIDVKELGAALTSMGQNLSEEELFVLIHDVSAACPSWHRVRQAASAIISTLHASACDCACGRNRHCMLCAVGRGCCHAPAVKSHRTGCTHLQVDEDNSGEIEFSEVRCA